MRPLIVTGVVTRLAWAGVSLGSASRTSGVSPTAKGSAFRAGGLPELTVRTAGESPGTKKFVDRLMPCSSSATGVLRYPLAERRG